MLQQIVPTLPERHSQVAELKQRLKQLNQASKEFGSFRRQKHAAGAVSKCDPSKMGGVPFEDALVNHRRKVPSNKEDVCVCSLRVS